MEKRSHEKLFQVEKKKRRRKKKKKKKKKKARLGVESFERGTF